jgi:hypothetical protein
MYEDKERLEQYKLIWLTRKTYAVLKKEKSRLKKIEKRDVSMVKILNNLILREYEKK